MIKRNSQKGFTLVEMLIAITLFIIVAFISIGAILTIFSANKKSQTSKTVVDNLNYTIESMVRNIRFGKTYHCGTGTPYNSLTNCSGGDTFIAVQSGANTYIGHICGQRVRYVV
jgi:prepilin-type N-terminal cleavage/methylation domain-containing protein